MGNTSNIILGMIIVVGVLAYFNVIEVNDADEIRNIPDNIDIEQVRGIVDDNVDIERSLEVVEEISDSVLPWNSLGLSNEEIFEIEDEIERLINIEREKYGLQPLVGNALLWEVTYSHSLDMAENNYFDHISLDGKEPTNRGIALGYYCEREISGWIYSGIAENIFLIPSGYSKSEIASEIVDGWMESPGHRENILTADYIYGEIAIAVSHEGTFPASEFVGAMEPGVVPIDIPSPALLITHNFAVCRP
jgi:hypothetical protein